MSQALIPPRPINAQFLLMTREHKERTEFLPFVKATVLLVLGMVHAMFESICAVPGCLTRLVAGPWDSMKELLAEQLSRLITMSHA